MPRGHEKTTRRGWGGTWAWWSGELWVRAVGEAAGDFQRGGTLGSVWGRLQSTQSAGEAGGRTVGRGLSCVLAEWGAKGGSRTNWSRVEFESGFLACVTERWNCSEDFGLLVRSRISRKPHA